MSNLTRRDFMKTSAAALGTAAIAGAAAAPARAVEPLKEFRVLQIGVGGIGGMDRGNIARHPKAKIVGLVDVNTDVLEKVGGQFPDAFRETDYRKAFSDHADKFDAVNVCTPDHQHAPMMLGAMALDKHVYGQKPLVQQLEELDMLAKMTAAKPHLATQTGNQRMQSPGRRVAVDILERGLLGPAIEAWVWTGTTRGDHRERDLPPAKDPPANIDWDLWLGPAEKQPYRDGIAPNHWRSWWDFGTAGLGDWGVHLLDVIMYSYPELTSPVAVKCDTPRAAHWYHTARCKSVMTYEVGSKKFKNKTFTINYADSGQMPDIKAFNLPMQKLPANQTIVVCEGGTLVLAAGGKLQLFTPDGKPVTPKDIDANEDVGEYKHWHNWIDKAMGDKDAKVWTGFDVGVRITEASILPVKASRFPGKELLWDRKTLTFTNHQEATDTVVRRKYRDGFAPPKSGKA